MTHGLETMTKINELAAARNKNNMLEMEKEHSKLVSELAKSPDLIIQEMNSFQAHLLHMVVGICGEAGELLDAIKKNAIYQKQLDYENVVEELGDLEFYLRGLRDALHIPRSVTLEQNITKLRKRYGEKYSNKAAQDRVDKTDISPDDLQDTLPEKWIGQEPLASSPSEQYKEELQSMDPSLRDKLMNGKWED